MTKPKFVRKRNFSYSSRRRARSTRDAARTFTLPRKRRTNMDPVDGEISATLSRSPRAASKRERAAAASSGDSSPARDSSPMRVESARAAFVRTSSFAHALACAFSASATSSQ